MNVKAWNHLILQLVPNRMNTKPREQGITMVLDRCQGLYATKDLLALTGDYIDHLKLTFGTSVFLDEDLIRRKIEIIRTHYVDIYPGGTLMEIALIQGVYPEYVCRAKELGFTALEISDGTITMSRQVRNDAIKRACDAGLKVISEVGKKDPTIHLSPTEICDQVAADLAAGANMVIMEARESGRGIGIYDENGMVREDELEALVKCLGDYCPKIIWEAPLQRQQAALILRCGPNVNLGNVKPSDVLGLEALRCGLRFETLRHFAPQLQVGDADE
ncbi:MAG: phosphosulfolactate synthase [Chloroflexota bacterium]